MLLLSRLSLSFDDDCSSSGLVLVVSALALILFVSSAYCRIRASRMAFISIFPLVFERVGEVEDAEDLLRDALLEEEDDFGMTTKFFCMYLAMGLLLNHTTVPAPMLCIEK